jgi:probable F420-dependent oxidoreductase
VHLGVQTPLLSSSHGRELLIAVAEQAEANELESLWVGEHVVRPRTSTARYPYTAGGAQQAAIRAVGLAEPFTALAFLCACTSRLRLGTGVIVLPQRNPVYVAKEAAAIDVLSGGRLELGIGVGWDRDEFAAVGASWERRGERADEYLAVVRALWAQDAAEYRGRHVELPLCTLEPRPLQAPPPVLVGGNSPQALRRAARTGDGWLAFDLTPDAFASRREALDVELGRAGRGRIAISVISGSVALDPPTIAAYAGAGADRLIVSVKTAEPDEAVARIGAARAAYDAAT